MTYLIAVLAVILLLVLGYAWYRRTASRRYLETLAGVVRALRRASADEASFRPVTTRDAELLEPHEYFEATVRELEAHGLTVLGDLVEGRPDGTAAGVSRWFVDEDRTVCGWFGVIRNQTINPVMLLFSESDAGSFFATLRGASTLSVAQPPAIHRAHCEWGEGLARQLEYHRAPLSDASKAGAAALSRVESLEDAVALVSRLRRSVTSWRAGQNPAVLLDQDVRCVLEDRYEELGPKLIKFMRSA